MVRRYTHIFDQITQDFTNVVRSVEDSLLWKDDLKSMFDLTCKYSSTCSRGGFNFNKKKFRFAQGEVEYVGFKLIKAIVPVDSLCYRLVLNKSDIGSLAKTL